MLLSSEAWSPAEVRKLTTLIAAERVRTESVLEAVPIAAGIFSRQLDLLCANEPMRLLAPIIRASAEFLDASLRQAVASGRAEATVRDTLGATHRLSIRLCGNEHEFVVTGQRAAVPATADPHPLVRPRLEECPVPLIVCGHSGQPLYLSSAARRLTGYEAGAVAEPSLADLFPEAA